MVEFFLAALENMVGQVEPAIPDPKHFIDHQFEASEYEKKLVQVSLQSSGVTTVQQYISRGNTLGEKQLVTPSDITQ